MSQSLNLPLIVAICGPTAVGKSKVTFELAKHFQAEIINFDSIQVFKELDIGSSKPPLEYLNEVPHHLISIAEPSAEFTAGDFKRLASELINGRLKEKRVVFLVGGTGVLPPGPY